MMSEAVFDAIIVPASFAVFLAVVWMVVKWRAFFSNASTTPAAPESRPQAPGAPRLTRVRAMSEAEFRRAHPDCISISPRWRR